MKKTLSCIFALVLLCSIYALVMMERAGVPGQIFNTLQSEFKVPASSVASLGSLLTLGCCVGMFLSAPLIDLMGGLVCGVIFGFMQLAVFTLIPFVSSFGQLQVLFCLLGLFQASLYLAPLKVIDTHFDKRYFSLLIGLTYVFAYGGLNTGIGMYAGWCRDHGGWRHVSVMLMLVSWAFLLVYTLFYVWKMRAHKHTPLGRAEILKKLNILSGINRQSMKLSYCGISNVMVFWCLHQVVAKKMFLDTRLLAEDTATNILFLAGTILTILMIFSGSISFLVGNRRRPFILSSTVMVSVGVLALLLGVFGGVARPWFYYIVYTLVCVGYSQTSVIIVTSREFVQPDKAASAIGFLNLLANGGLAGIIAVSGWILDAFEKHAVVLADQTVYPSVAYVWILTVLLLVSLPSVYFAAKTPETNGVNQFEKKTAALKR